MTKVIRQYLLMLKWQALSQKPMLPINIVIQIMISVGFIFGLSFFYPQIDPATAKYLTTGAPTIILLMIGLVFLPQIVGMARKEGTYDYIWSLPVPRLVYIAADATIWVLVALPGVIIALIMGAIYFDFELAVSLLIIPGFLLISISGVFLGYTLAHGVSRPEIAHVITQVIAFAIMLFSPIMYPVEQLPDWLAKVHSVLPIQYMADISRGTLTDLDVDLGRAFLIVGIWSIASLIATNYFIKRRQ